jgi:hypothetical protein
MTIRITRVLTDAEYHAMGEEAVANGWYRNDRRMFTPGLALFEPWYFDPTGESQRAGKYVMCEPGHPMLSVHYWRDWAAKRAPIAVVCPNGEVWEIDRKSSNGDGWVVTGDLPNISCSPSIVVDGYHGFLGINGAPPGQFTADVDGRPPNGIARPIVERQKP